MPIRKLCGSSRLHLTHAGFSVFPAIYLREQADYAISLYHELTKHGLDCPVEAFLQEVATKGAFTFRDGWIFQFRYGVLLDAWASAFGHECTMARVFEAGSEPEELLSDFLSLLQRFGPTPKIASMSLPNQLNQSIGKEASQRLRLRWDFSEDNAYVGRRYAVTGGWMDEALKHPRTMSRWTAM